MRIVFSGRGQVRSCIHLISLMKQCGKCDAVLDRILKQGTKQ